MNNENTTVTGAAAATSTVSTIATATGSQGGSQGAGEQFAGRGPQIGAEAGDSGGGNSVLSLRKVSYQYGKNQRAVLKEVTADFKPGRLYAIVGKSGAGKTTLLSLISGLDTATSGEVLYRGKDVGKLDRDNYRARSVGTVFQGYNLLTNATALENIVLSMSVSGIKDRQKKRTALNLLRSIDIDQATANRKVLKMSGGEQQRVGIARALAHNPDVIIADEPTGNLDRDTREVIMRILLRLAHEDGRCVILVTHSNTVSRYADQVLVLNRGVLSKVHK